MYSAISVPNGRAAGALTGASGLTADAAVFNFVLVLIFVSFLVSCAGISQFLSITGTAGLKPRLAARFWSYMSEGPFGNTRFLFFIFMLLPVRTLFAHQWLTMPEYILRSYPKGVGDKMEWLVNWINPMIIFVGVPIATVLTRRFHVYTMMIVGSLVSAVPTFLLCFGPDLKLLLAYFVLFSVGEALWSARFLEYASELAPVGRVARPSPREVPFGLSRPTGGPGR